jgi:hypothetical protein
VHINTKFGLYQPAKPALNYLDMRIKYAKIKTYKKNIVRNFEVKDILRNLERSLDRLNCDKIQTYFAHDILPLETNAQELEDMFGLLKQKGLINFSGFSTHLDSFQKLDFSNFSFIDRLQIYNSDLANLPAAEFQIYSIHSLFRNQEGEENFWVNFDAALVNPRIKKIVVGTSKISHLTEILIRAGY